LIKQKLAKKMMELIMPKTRLAKGIWPGSGKLPEFADFSFSKNTFLA
jgi:hypothetical protein